MFAPEQFPVSFSGSSPTSFPKSPPPPFKAGACLLTAALLLGGCGGHPARAPRDLASRAQANPAVSSGLGEDLLASVDSARAAIAERDTTAASNDIGKALYDAEWLPSETATSTSLFMPPPAPVDAGPKAGPAQAIDSFGAESKLLSAESAIENGDMGGADADLGAIQAGVPRSLVPANLPLIQARQDLDAAQTALDNGLDMDMRADLKSAQLVLDGYGAKGRQVADAIGADLADGRIIDETRLDEIGQRLSILSARG